VPSTVIGARAPEVVRVPVTVFVPVASRVIPAFAVTATKLKFVPVDETTSPVPEAATVPDAVTVPDPVSVTSPVEVIAATDTLVPLTVTGERAAVVVIVPVTVAVDDPTIDTPELPETAAKLIAVPVAEKVEPVPVALTAAVEVTVPVPVSVVFPVEVMPAVCTFTPLTVTGARLPVVVKVVVVELSEPATLMPPLALIVVKLIVVPVASKVEPDPVTEIAAEPVTVVLPFRVTLPTEVIAPVERVVVSDSRATVLEELVVAVETLEPVTVIGAVAAVVVSAPETEAEPEPVIDIPE
jgi:hypothetical protein